MPDEVRDARPWLQIVVVGDLCIADPGSWRAGGMRPAGVWADASALPRFTAFLEHIAAADPIWRKAPTWLVAVGRHTANDHPASQTLAHAWLRRWSSLVSPSGLLALDATPGSDPVRWPAPPLRERTPNDRVELQLFGLDRADDSDAVSRLARLIKMFQPEPPLSALRFVASNSLVDPAALGVHFAIVASSPSDTTDRVVTADTLAAHGGTQACTILRLQWSPSRARTVILERWQAARHNGIGPYAFVPAGTGADLASEQRIEL